MCIHLVTTLLKEIRRTFQKEAGLNLEPFGWASQKWHAY